MKGAHSFTGEVVRNHYWILLTTFALATFATVPVMASPVPAGKASIHNAAAVQCKKHKKNGKKHHKKHKGAAKHAN